MSFQKTPPSITQSNLKEHASHNIKSKTIDSKHCFFLQCCDVTSRGLVSCKPLWETTVKVKKHIPIKICHYVYNIDQKLISSGEDKISATQYICTMIHLIKASFQSSSPYQCTKHFSHSLNCICL